MAILLLSSLPAIAQNKNLDKLPQSKRDSILIDIAKSTVLKYTEGYYLESDIPTIKDLGIFKAERKYDEKYNGIRMYSVSYPLSAEEKAFFTNSDALVSVKVRADIGKAVEIRDANGFGLGDLDKGGVIQIKLTYIPVEKRKQMARDMVRGTTKFYESSEII